MARKASAAAFQTRVSRLFPLRKQNARTICLGDPSRVKARKRLEVVDCDRCEGYRSFRRWRLPSTSLSGLAFNHPRFGQLLMLPVLG